jgi:hypothetical protein
MGLLPLSGMSGVQGMDLESAGVESSAVAQPTIQALIYGATRLVGPHLNKVLTSRVVSFERVTLADSAFIQFLREIDA